MNAPEVPAARSEDLAALRQRVADLESAMSREKQVEETLREREEHYRTLVETSPDAITLTDLTGKFLAANPQMLRLHGFNSFEELRTLGWTAFDLVIEEERPRALENARRALQEGTVRGLEYQVRRKDGSTFPIELSASVIRDAQGQPQAFMAVTHDVTKRKQLEHEREVNRDLLDAVLKSNPAPVFAKDRAGRYTLVNPAFDRLMGIPAAELIGKTVHECWPAPDAAVYHQKDLELMAADHVQSYEYGVFDAEGRRRTVVFQKACTHEPGGPVSGLVGTVLDITALKQVEAALRESEIRFRSLVETTSDWIWEIDAEARYTYVSPKITELLGYAPEELLGKTPFDLMPPEEARRLQRLVEPFLGSAQPFAGIENWNRHKDGRLVLLESSGIPILDAEGRTRGYRGIDRDITVRKRAEEEQRRLARRVLEAQKFESLGILAGGVAHDFNNLLTAILANADLAMADLPTDSPVRRSLQEIEHASHRAAELCRQMLDYSGHGQMAVQALNFSRLVQDQIHLLRASISRKIAVGSHFAGNLPAIEGDATQLRQVVMNLVINASEAIGDAEGMITLTMGLRSCDAAYLRDSRMPEVPAAGMYVYLDVADNGCGMAPETKARIFDPFFTTKFTGRGLGLAAVLGIVRGHKGAIKVESEPGKGSTFRVLFPASSRAPVRLDLRPGSETWRGEGTILLVDDEEPVRAVAAMLLERLGFHVLTAADGREAVARFQENEKAITCVLLDLTMPKMDGVETLRELRRIRPGVLVLVASGYNAHEISRRFADQIPAGFIQKPYHLASLTSKLREVLARSPTH